MNFEYKKPVTRLNPEKNTRVIIGGTHKISAIYPIIAAINPMKTTKEIYFPDVTFDLKVHLAFAKKLNVTATKKATKFAMA